MPSFKQVDALYIIRNTGLTDAKAKTIVDDPVGSRPPAPMVTVGSYEISGND